MNINLNKEQIEKILHHRDPYLMVDSVSYLTETMIKTKKVPNAMEPYLKGHFPGAPIVPGAMLQELCTQSAGILITKFYSPVENYDSTSTIGYALGVLTKVEDARFKGIVKPFYDIDAEVELVDHLGDLFKFKAQVFQKKLLKATVKFSLVNLEDSLLI